MDAEQFVENWVRLKAELLDSFMDVDEGADVAEMIKAMKLSPSQNAQLRTVIDAVLRDTMYSLLLGLDGAASIGDDQQTYAIRDEDGNLVSEDGELEAAAWEAFHGENGSSDNE